MGEGKLIPQNVCPGCGAPVACAVAAGESQCWCMAMPVLPAELRSGKGCYCPACLVALTQGADAPGQTNG